MFLLNDIEIIEKDEASAEEYYAALQRGGLVSTERDADEAYALIDDQDETDPMGQTERNRADGTESLA